MYKIRFPDNVNAIGSLFYLVQSRFEALLSPLPEAVRTLRMDFVVAMVFNSLAGYAEQVALNGLDESRHALLVDQLVAAAVGALLSG